MERVLTGVDGSQAAREALRWAFDEARCREAALQVVLVAAPAYLYGSEAPYWADRDEAMTELAISSSSVPIAISVTPIRRAEGGIGALHPSTSRVTWDRLDVEDRRSRCPWA